MCVNSELIQYIEGLIDLYYAGELSAEEILDQIKELNND